MTISAMTTSDWLGLCLMPFVLFVLMAGLQSKRVRDAIHPELSRKLVHVAMGCTTLAFPWVFTSYLPVLLLCAGSIILLFGIRTVPVVNKRFGPVMGAVGRNSFGEIYFPIAVATIFVLSKGNAVLFCIPMLVLTFGDSAAALTGTRYGRHKYGGYGQRKSVEGSAALFVTALVCTLVPLLTMGRAEPTHTLLVGLIIAIVATLLEAVARRGLDNLLIPLGSFLVLTVCVNDSTRHLLCLFVVAVVVSMAVVLWLRGTIRVIATRSGLGVWLGLLANLFLVGQCLSLLTIPDHSVLHLDLLGFSLTLNCVITAIVVVSACAVDIVKHRKWAIWNDPWYNPLACV